jgi:hypothetical protein
MLPLAIGREGFSRTFPLIVCGTPFRSTWRISRSSAKLIGLLAGPPRHSARAAPRCGFPEESVVLRYRCPLWRYRDSSRAACSSGCMFGILRSVGGVGVVDCADDDDGVLSRCG